MDRDELNRLRGTARELLTRAREDPAFAARLRREPATVLREAGLPEDGVDDVLREIPDGGEPADVRCGMTCLWTCSFTSV